MSRSKVLTIMAVSFSFIVCSILLVANLLSAEPEQQRPLITVDSEKIDLIYEYAVDGTRDNDALTNVFKDSRKQK